MADSVIQAVTSKFVEYSVDALKKQLNYLCFYSSNVQTLAEALEELNNRHQSVQQKVDVARANSEVITPEVDAWFRKVVELKIRSDEILRHNEEIQRSSVRKWLPLLHYSLARKARKAARDCVALRNTPFDTISNPGIPAELPPVPNPSYSVFESHKVIEDRIMHALKDPNVSSIGIWGIGGVGKTEMTKNIERKVRDEKTLFEHVVVLVVSQQPDLPKLQSQIASALNLPLVEESLDLRQKKLYHKLMAEKSILIIFDDLWERLDLEVLGIPSQSKHCKLILTSRDEGAFTSTGVQNIFQLVILTEEESWRFFRDNAGINDDDDDDSRNELVEIARKVERECKGLPLALKIVASALKGKRISSWKTALEELKKAAPEIISGVLKGVYQPLKYSFEMLESKQQKDLFLLCCLFPEDYLISIEELLRCGIGLRIFKGFENLTEVREKVESLLQILLSRSLLIEGNRFSDNLLEGSMFSDNLHVRMHDVMRDVGIWITTEEKHLFKISHMLNKWPLMMEEDYTCISLRSSHNSIIFPESIVCPKLEFLRLHYDAKLPKNFFNGMSELKVLEALRIRPIPPSIGELNSLRTLFLHDCEIFQTVSELGKLINLEILSLKRCHFEMLPVEIGGLKNLKQMHISNCGWLREVAFGVLSKLARLEELVILGSFDSWEAEDGGENRVACLSELNDLKNLINLKIEIKNPSVVPIEKPLWFQKVKKCNISISSWEFPDFEKKYFQKAILLGKEVENSLGHWIYDKASDAEYLNLEGSNCMNVWNRLSQNCGNLSCLKRLRLAEFTNIRYLDEGLQKGAIFRELESLHIQDSLSLQQIFICKEQLYLKNLQNIFISKCDNLSYLFSLSVAQSLVQLSDLHVDSCKTMKEIFKKDDGESVEINKIELPKLRFLYFEDLESFCHFCNGIDRIELPQLDRLTLRNLPSMKMTKGDNNEYLIPKVAWMNFNFFGLTHLNVIGIGNFKCMFSPSVISGVPNLISLQVRNCSMLEQVIGKDDENVGETIFFPNLMKLSLSNLPNILTFCYKAVQLPSLEELTIDDCPKMLKFVEEHPNHISNSTPFLNKQVYCPKLRSLHLNVLNISAVFSPLTFTSLTNLKSLEVTDCEELEHIIIKEEEGETAYDQKVPFEFLYLVRLPKLYGSIFQMEHPLEFPRLYHIIIGDCPMLEKFSLGSVHLPELEIIPILEIHSEKNYFIISIKDISFSSDLPEDIWFRFLPIGSSQSFANVIFLSKRRKIVGKFKIEKIQTGTEYEIMLMIMWDEDMMWVEDTSDEDESEGIDAFEIELKIPGESKLQQRTETLKNQAKGIWTEISIGKFIMREPQQINEELEFSLRNAAGTDLWVKGVRIVEV